MAKQPVTASMAAPEAAEGRPDLSVVLVCWNNKEYLEPCLRSLYESDLHSRFDVVVVDNGSTDGSQRMLQSRFPAVKLIQNDGNVGLGKASNQGIEATLGRYVLLLNNDTLVNGTSLDTMVSFMDSHADAGAVGGTLLNADGSFQAAYAGFSTLLEEFLIATRIGELIWAGYPSHVHSPSVQSVGWLSSACLLVRREALEQVGLLDEEYFIYGDEADLQYRLQRHEWKVYFLPEVTTIHYGGRSMDRWRRRKMVNRGKLLFYKKNYGALRTGILRLMLGSLSAAKITLWGLVWPLPSRRKRASLEIDSNVDVLKLALSLR